MSNLMENIECIGRDFIKLFDLLRIVLEKQTEKNEFSKSYIQLFSQPQFVDWLRIELTTNTKFYKLLGDEYKNTDSNLSLTFYTKSAELGDPEAQNILGDIYYGEFVEEFPDVKVDNQKSFEWFKKSAEQGYAAGQINLGFLYKHGVHVQQNYTEALKWYQLASDQNDPRGHCYLADMYLEGLGVEKDKNQAYKLLQLSANQNDFEAQWQLGMMYYTGDGITQNYNEAFKLFTLSAISNYAPAQYSVGRMSCLGEGTDESFEEGIKWLKLAVDQQDADAQLFLADIYFNGVYLPTDHAEAVKLYTLSANSHNLKAMIQLGHLYFSGKYVKKSYGESLKWYHEAKLYYPDETTNDLKVQYNLGKIYFTSRHYDQALIHLEICAKKDYYASFSALADTYKARNNYQEAFKYYKLALDQNKRKIPYELGLLYRNGHGVDKDYKEALKQFKLSADNGFIKANKAIKDTLYLMLSDDILSSEICSRYFQYDTLQQELEEIRYRPPEKGGPGYEEAKRDYELITNCPATHDRIQSPDHKSEVQFQSNNSSPEILPLES